MRDNLKSIEYFNGFIEEEKKRIDRFSDKIKNGEVKAARLIPVKIQIHNLKLGVLIAKYSRGDSLAALEEEYLQLLNEWEEVLEPNYYNKNLKMVSLAVLFHVSKEHFEKLRVLKEKANIEDWLIEYLINPLSYDVKTNNGELLFADIFSTLQKVVYEENKMEWMKKYLSKDWYNEECGCYEAHKSKQNVYYGYWSFEAGAIAKIMNIEDSILKNMPYYPYDLVHYKR